MLRAYDRPGGIGIYCRNIVKHMIAQDEGNHYVLMYNNIDHVGTYNHLPNVTEVFISGKNPLIWDQLSIPFAAKKHGVDLLFNTKFSLPLLGSFAKMMKLHGASWFVRPDLYGKLDILYVKAAMPIYCKIANFLLSNSDCTTNDFKHYVGVPATKIKTVNLAYGDNFQVINDKKYLQHVRDKYSLPENFILTVTSFDPRKNFQTIAATFKKVSVKYKKLGKDVSLVVVGKDCHRYLEDHDISELSDHIVFPGWVDQSDLPAIYSLAKAYFFPSVYEEFGIPVVEAMACGCPIVSSTTGAIPDLISDAGLLSDPFDVDSHANNLLEILTNQELAGLLSEKGLIQAKQFSWDKAANETISVINSFEQKKKQ